MRKELIIAGLIILLINSVLAADVAYLYKYSRNIDENVVRIFEELNQTIDYIKDRNIKTTDFSKYKLMFVGDERFTNKKYIPIDKVQSVIANYHHGVEFGLTDDDGISQLGSTTPLSVKKDGKVIQVYTQAFLNLNRIAIPYYYLDDLNKAPAFHKVAATYTGNGDFGSVIAYANPGEMLVDGRVLEKKSCFFGIVKSDFWTEAARKMFKECAAYVVEPSILCKINSDCGTDGFIGNKFCTGKDVYQDFITYTCNNANTTQAFCSNATIARKITECASACVNGECAGISCEQDSDCDDENPRTVDQCVNPNTTISFCRNTPINCLNDLDCGITGFIGEEFCSGNNIAKRYQTSICINPGTLESNCNIDIVPKQVQSCDDEDIFTLDKCLDNPARCVHDTILCSTNSDCGETITNLFCKGKEVWNNISQPECNNPGSVNAFCSTENIQTFNRTCEDSCVNGECITSIHDIGFDFNLGNSINGIKIVQNGINVLGEEVKCNENFIVKFKVRNKGEFNETINVSGKSPISWQQALFNLNAGELSTERSKTLNLEEGEYNIKLEAEILGFADSNISDNTAIRSIKVKCTSVINCTKNSDCGTDGFIGFASCSSNDLFQTFRVWKCNNPNSTSSFCSKNDSLMLKQDCGEDFCEDFGLNYCKGNNVYHNKSCFEKGCSDNACFSKSKFTEELVKCCPNGCSNGECISECPCTPWVDAGCDNGCGEGYRKQIRNCTNKNCEEERCIPDSSCRVICSKNSDCGSDGVINSPFCSNNDLFQTNRTWKCVNPNTSSSFCNKTDKLVLKQDCGEGSYSENFCYDNDVYRTFTDRGCLGNACFENSIKQKVEECENGCSNGECNKKERKLDFVIVADTSSSMDWEWKQLCKNKGWENIIKELQNKSIDINYKLYGIIGGNTLEDSCAEATAVWWDKYSTYSFGAGYMTDENGEYWGPAVQFIINKFKWREDAEKIIVIISDTDPTGYREYGENGYYHNYGWRKGNDEAEIIERTWKAAKNKNITLSVARTSEELFENKITKNKYKSIEKLDVQEAFEEVAYRTSGIVKIHTRSGSDFIEDIKSIILN